MSGLSSGHGEEWHFSVCVDVISLHCNTEVVIDSVFVVLLKRERTLAVSAMDSLTPTWMSSEPRNSACPPIMVMPVSLDTLFRSGELRGGGEEASVCVCV